MINKNVHTGIQKTSKIFWQSQYFKYTLCSYWVREMGRHTAVYQQRQGRRRRRLVDSNAMQVSTFSYFLCRKCIQHICVASRKHTNWFCWIKLNVNIKITCLQKRIPRASFKNPCENKLPSQVNSAKELLSIPKTKYNMINWTCVKIRSKESFCEWTDLFSLLYMRSFSLTLPLWNCEDETKTPVFVVSW